MSNGIRDTFGWVEENKEIDNIIGEYADKLENYNQELSEQLDKKLNEKGWINSMGVTYKNKSKEVLSTEDGKNV